MGLQFGQVAGGKSLTSKVFIKSKTYRKASMYLSTPATRICFVSSAARIPATLTNSEEGYWLNITYRPTALGTHSSRLLIDFGEGSRGLAPARRMPARAYSGGMYGNRSDRHTARQYTANWTSPENEVIDYYMVTRTRYAGGNSYEEKLPGRIQFTRKSGFDKIRLGKHTT